MIDTHSHLYSEEFEQDIDDVISRARAAGITKCFLPAIDSSTHERMLGLSRRYPEFCYPMIGVHPCSVKENYLSELDEVKSLLAAEKFWAIGETGLDFYWDKSFIQQQYESLRMHAELALEHNLPLVLHTREAMRETINVVKEFSGRNLKGIFHCFGGSLDEANQIIQLGFKLGIGGVLTYKKSGLAQVLAEIDIQHLVLETDAPYLTPVPFRGKRNESSYLALIAKKLAEVKGISTEEVERVTTTNAMEVFDQKEA